MDWWLGRWTLKLPRTFSSPFLSQDLVWLNGPMAGLFVGTGGSRRQMRYKYIWDVIPADSANNEFGSFTCDLDEFLAGNKISWTIFINLLFNIYYSPFFTYIRPNVLRYSAFSSNHLCVARKSEGGVFPVSIANMAFLNVWSVWWCVKGLSSYLFFPT